MSRPRDQAGQKRTRSRISQEGALSFGADLLARFPSGIVEGTTADLARLGGIGRCAAIDALSILSARGLIVKNTRRASGFKSLPLVIRFTEKGMGETWGRLGGDSHLGETASGDAARDQSDKTHSLKSLTPAAASSIPQRRIDVSADGGRLGGDSMGETRHETEIVEALQKIAQALERQNEITQAQTEALLSLTAVLSKASQPVAAPSPRQPEPVEPLSPEVDAKVEKASHVLLRKELAAGKEISSPDGLRRSMAARLRRDVASGNWDEVNSLLAAENAEAERAAARERLEEQGRVWEEWFKIERECLKAGTKPPPAPLKNKRT